MTTVPQGLEQNDVHNQTLSSDLNTEDQIDSVQQEIRGLRDRLELLTSQVDSLTARQDAGFGHGISDEEMTRDQLEAFRSLAEVRGTDHDARKRAEEVFARIEGTPISQAVVRQLTAFLKSKGWAIVCCNSAAVPVWKRYSRSRARSGYMQLRHKTPTGTRVMHANTTTFPRVVLVAVGRRVEGGANAGNLKAAVDVFRQNLESVITAQGVSKSALAAAASTSRSYIDSVLKGAVDPSLSRCDALARAVGHSLADLLSGSPIEPS